MRVRAHARGRSSGAAPQCARSRRPLRVTLRARASHRIASPRARTREPPSAWRRKAPYVRPRPRGIVPVQFWENSRGPPRWRSIRRCTSGSARSASSTARASPLLRVAAGRSPSMSASRPISRTDRCVAPPSPPRDPPCRPDRQFHDETRGMPTRGAATTARHDTLPRSPRRPPRIATKSSPPRLSLATRETHRPSPRPTLD